MGITLGWLAVALALTAGSPPPSKDATPIKYRFRIAEVRGLEWRAAAYSKLKPVTRRGAVTIWTAPRGFESAIPAGTIKNSITAPTVIADAGAPAHVSTRKTISYVTQVAWRDDEPAPRETSESVRQGVAATIAGRKLDQGTLVQLVIEDTDVHSVHTVTLNSPSHATKGQCDQDALACCEAKSKDCNAGKDSSCPASTSAQSAAKTRDPQARKTAGETAAGTCCAEGDGQTGIKCPAVKTSGQATSQPCAAPPVAIQIPEVSREEVAGEWLIPHDEVLVISFGPHTIADADGKAVTRERLAMITAEDAPEPTAHPAATPVAPAPFPSKIPPPAAIAPMPELPSRTIPQGIHADGTPAPLPTLPEDENHTPPTHESSKPVPTPQSKKPIPGDVPSPRVTPVKPSTESKPLKTSFLTETSLVRPSGFLPLAKTGLQMLLPFKPILFRLNYRPKLELELVGRVGLAWEPSGPSGPVAE